MRRFAAKLTSKNQLTLPVGISALLHARPGDMVTFVVDDDAGEVRVTGPDMEARLSSWAGRWGAARKGVEPGEADAWIRRVRGERD